MSPSRLHKKLVDSLADYMLALSCTTGCREYPTRKYGYDGYIDLLVDVSCLGQTRVAIEAELTADRVGNDLIKGCAVEAGLLLIATPTVDVARACQRKILRLKTNPPAPLEAAVSYFHGGGNAGNTPQILALPLGPALTQLRNKFPAKNTCLCISKQRPQARNAETPDSNRPTHLRSSDRSVSGHRSPNPNERAIPPPDLHASNCPRTHRTQPMREPP